MKPKLTIFEKKMRMLDVLTNEFLPAYRLSRMAEIDYYHAKEALAELFEEGKIDRIMVKKRDLDLPKYKKKSLSPSPQYPQEVQKCPIIA